MRRDTPSKTPRSCRYPAEPDLELIEYVGTGVAMGNGAQVLKDHADLVADHIDEDGLAKAFRTLGLIG